MSHRVFVPATLTDLARYAEEGGIGPAPVRGHAVTGWVRDAWPEAEEEQWSYTALMAAADDSAERVHESRAEGEHPRRVVLVVEVESMTEDHESSSVSIGSAVALRLVRAVHADTEDVDVTSPQELGDLAWYGVQEIPALLA